MTTISVIVGSTRQDRFSEKPAHWIYQELKKRDGIEVRLLDLRDFPIPFFDQPVPPAMPGRAPYEHEVVKRWTAEIAASDGFVFVRQCAVSRCDRAAALRWCQPVCRAECHHDRRPGTAEFHQAPLAARLRHTSAASAGKGG